MERPDEYRIALQNSYVSECIGVELYSMLGAGSHGASASRRKVLLILENIEAQTRDALAELIAEAGSAPDQGDASKIARNIVNVAINKTWEDLHAWLLEGSQQGSAVYRKIKEYSTNPEDERIASILHHVDVVESIYRAEANGESKLDLAMEYLNAVRRRHVLNESQ